ncbi:MAG: InlB B-repeat-containing protein, partial [Clostridia bacterium]
MIIITALLLIMSIGMFVACADDNTPTTKFDVTFNLNGAIGVAPVAQVVESGKFATEPTAPTREGYTFGGWFKEATCANAWTFATSAVTANVELFAKWTAVITGLEISAPAKKTTFDAGDQFVSDGLIVSSVWGDGRKEKLARSEIYVNSIAFDSVTIGVYKIEIILLADQTKKVSYDVNVVEPRAVKEVRIKANSVYDKQILIDEQWNDDNVFFEIEFTNGAVEDIANSSVMSTPGATEITFEYSFEPKTTQTIIVTVAIVDPAQQPVTALVIQSLPTITTFQKGGTFSSDGLVVCKKLVGYGDRLFPATGEFNISAVDMQTVGSQVVTLTSTKTTTVTATFDINIVDTTGATITGIALNQSSTQQKEFYVGETFNANGLRVDKKMSNNVAVGLTSAEYVIDSALFDTATVGTYSIKIKLNGSEFVVAYDVIVKAVDFDGLYYVTEEDVAHGLAAQAYALKIENGKYSAMYEPVGGTFAPLKPYVIARNENGQVQIDAWTYDSVAKTFTNATDGVAKLLRPTDILITIEHSTYKGFILVANENGCVEQKFIDGLGHVGVFYMDANKQTKLTPSTKFTQSTTIYLIGPDVDYTGKPFIGEYYTPFNNQLVLKVGAKQMEMEDMVFDYIAIESNGIWILDVSAVGGKMMFNPVTKQMEMDGNTPLKMLDRTTQAIVTFTSTNGNVTPQFLGKRVVTKGESLPALVKGQYNYIKYTFATYNGAAITADITIDLTAAEDVNVSNAISGKFGTFANYVVFDEQTETFAISKKGVQVATGAFVLVDKIGERYIFTLTIGAQNVTVE